MIESMSAGNWSLTRSLGLESESRRQLLCKVEAGAVSLAQSVLQQRCRQWPVWKNCTINLLSRSSC